jgi:hypothetical protein
MRGIRLLSCALFLCLVPTSSWAWKDPINDQGREVQQLEMTGEFDKLEAMAAELRKSDARFVGSNSKLYHFYLVLGATAGPPGSCKCDGSQRGPTFEEKEPILKKWLTEHPQSITARLALSELFITHAWHARGEDYADKVTADQWKLFYDRLEVARTYLDRLDPKDDPMVYHEHLNLAEDLFSSRAELDRVYAAATRDYPRFFHFYTDRARILQEKWFDRPGELGDFAQSLLSVPGGEDGQIAYTYVAGRLSREYTCRQEYEQVGLKWPVLKEAYRTRDRLYGLRSLDLNFLLSCAIVARDFAFAKQLVPRIADDEWAPSVWGSKEAFDANVAWVQVEPAAEP